jgi:hypothetical protein
MVYLYGFNYRSYFYRLSPGVLLLQKKSNQNVLVTFLSSSVILSL